MLPTLPNPPTPHAPHPLSLRRLLFVISGGRSEPDSGPPAPDDLLAILARHYQHRRIALRDDYRQALTDDRLADALVLTIIAHHLDHPTPDPTPHPTPHIITNPTPSLPTPEWD